MISLMRTKIGFLILILLLCGLMWIHTDNTWGNERGKKMSETWMNIGSLIKKVDTYRNNIPTELARSYPVLIERDGKYLIAFMFYYKKGTPPDPPKVSSPRYLMIVEPVMGELIEFKRVKPSDFGFDWPESKPLGIHKLKAEITMDKFLKMQDELYSLYDSVFAIYVKRHEVRTDEKKNIIFRFQELFNDLVEKPLIPYYRALNPSFFEWLEANVEK